MESESLTSTSTRFDTSVAVSPVTDELLLGAALQLLSFLVDMCFDKIGNMDDGDV